MTIRNLILRTLVFVLLLITSVQIEAQVTMTLSITPTSPPLANNATDKTLAKVDCGKNAVYGVTCSYSGKPRFIRESRITKTEVTFTVEADSPNVTCTISKINNNNATVTASSLVPGTYKITVKAELTFTYTRFRVSRVKKYSKTVIATLDVLGKLQISSAEYLPVKCDRQKVTVTADATLTGGTLTLSATDKLKLYAAETGGTGSNSLTLTLVNNSATCYVASGESPSNNASDQNLTASYSGDNVESATKDVTVYELKIEAPGKMVDIGTGNFIVPVMYNDDHDCGLAYTANWNCSVNCSAVSSSGTCTPDTHRELEPVWDYLYAGIYGEDDLVECKIEIKPIDMDGNVTVYPGSSNIRIWTQINKGEKSSIISARNNNHSYYVSQLPQIVYVEGINIGSDSLYVKYTPPSSKSIAQTKLLDIAVVSLVEKQNGTRKIINTNAIPIKFSVEGGNIFNGKCTWTVPNHNNTTSIGSNDNIDVTYGASGCNVTLPENAANRRFTTTVSVSIDGKLELSKTIRVAQATYQGTSVKTTEADRRLEVIGLATPPSGFANTELPDVVATVYSQKWFEKEYTGAWTKGTPPKSVTINDERLQYAPKKTNAYGLEVANRLTANNKRVYGIFVLPGAYNIFKKEDIISIAEHEIQHSRQDIEIASGTCNLRTIDNYHGGDYSKYITHVTQ